MANLAGVLENPGKVRHAGPKLGSSNAEVLLDQLGFNKEELEAKGYCFD